MLRKNVKLKTSKKPLTRFRPLILSRHPSHNVFRRELPLMGGRSVIRFGSTTPINDGRVEINSVEAVRNSASKLKMKRCFDNSKVQTAMWIHSTEGAEVLGWAKDKYPLIKKSFFGSRGKGNYLIKNEDELRKHLHDLDRYLFEHYYDYVREYRLHVTKNGCFYSCRKMLRKDAPEDKRFQRHDDNCVWILEQNPQFDKPVNWDEIVKDAVRALSSVGLDVGAIDVRVQSAKTSKGQERKSPKWIIIETGSAPSMGQITEQKYKEILPVLINEKLKSNATK